MKFKAQCKQVPVNFGGQDVFVREFTIREQRQIHARIKGETSKLEPDFNLVEFMFLEHALVDGDGNQIQFTPEDIEDLPRSEVRRLADTVNKINGYEEKNDK